jgi:hypothetical protein
MPRTLLIGSPSTSWRAWLKENRENRDLLVLDPTDPDHGQLSRLALFRGEKLVDSRFYGSLDASRAPHVIIAAIAHLLPLAAEDVIVQLFPFRGGPLNTHVVRLIAQLVNPAEILVPSTQATPSLQLTLSSKTNASRNDQRRTTNDERPTTNDQRPTIAMDLEGFPTGPQEVELEAAFPETVRAAQRKANWLKLLESCVEHEVDLHRVPIEGARLGSGHRIKKEQLAKVGIEHVLHAESSGGTLFLIAEEEPSDQSLARGLDVFHCGRAHVVPPGAYNGLLCSFARQTGEDFGTGIIQEIDFESATARILCDAVKPAPVRILKLGGLKIDTAGREMGEARPWHV